jgi:hypothetical protein
MADDIKLPQVGDTFQGRRVVEVHVEREWFWTVDPNATDDPDRYGWKKHSLEALRLRGGRLVSGEVREAADDPPELAEIRARMTNQTQAESDRPIKSRNR